MMARLRAPWQQVAAAVARLDPTLFASADDVRAVLQVRRAKAGACPACEASANMGPALASCLLLTRPRLQAAFDHQPTPPPTAPHPPTPPRPAAVRPQRGRAQAASVIPGCGGPAGGAGGRRALCLGAGPGAGGCLAVLVLALGPTESCISVRMVLSACSSANSSCRSPQPPPTLPTYLQVPRLAPRLRSLLFQHEAPGQLEDALGTLRCHAAAQRELRASATFEAVLRHALVLG